MVLAHRIPPESRGGVHLLFKPPYAIESLSSLLLIGHAIAYRWRSLPRVRQRRVDLKVVLVTGAACAGLTSHPEGSQVLVLLR